MLLPLPAAAPPYIDALHRHLQVGDVAGQWWRLGAAQVGAGNAKIESTADDDAAVSEGIRGGFLLHGGACVMVSRPARRLVEYPGRAWAELGSIDGRKQEAEYELFLSLAIRRT
jgi:hypothetical protein